MQTRRYQRWEEEPGTSEKVRDYKIPLSAGRRVIEARNAMDYEKIRERASTYTLRKVYARLHLFIFSPLPRLSILSVLFANSYRSRSYFRRSLKTPRGLEVQYLPSENLHATLSAKLRLPCNINVRSARESRRFRLIIAGHRNECGKRAEWTEWLLVA